MAGKVHIKRLRIPTNIGVQAVERSEKQDIWLDLEYSTDINKAANSDQITDTIDYATICRELTEYVAQTKYQLIEALVENIADFIQRQFSIGWLRLTLSKSPFDLPNVDRVSITIERP